MKHNDLRNPKEVADDCEMLAQQAIEQGDTDWAKLHMEPAHAVRRVLKTLHRLNHRVHSGYDFNADPDGMTLEVGAVLDGYTPPNSGMNDGQSQYPIGETPDKAGNSQ